MKMYRYILVFWASLITLSTANAQQIDPATGGGSISADDFASGTFTSLSGPVLTETSPGQISVGFIEFTAPTGFEWDTGGADPTVTVTLAPGNNGNTKLAIQFSSRTASKLIFEVTSSSDNPPARPGQATFSGFRVRPTTGTLPNSGDITNTGNSAPAGNTSYGSLNMIAGAAAQIRVETEADGSGQVVPAQSLTAGNSLTVYSIVRDQFDNLVPDPNQAADGWNIVNGTDGVNTADLTPANDNKSATFSSTDTGSGAINAAKSGLTSVKSGIITVESDVANSISIITQPSSSVTAGTVFPQQPVIHVVDVFGNRVKSDNSTIITATRNLGTGTLLGTTSLTVQQGEAAFTNLKHNVANTINIKFDTPAFTSVTSSNITVTPGAANQLAFTVQPQNGAKNNALSPGPTVQIQDSLGNDVAQSGTSVSVAIVSGPVGGSITNNSTTTVSTDGSGKSLFDDLAFDTNGQYTIEATATGLAADTSNTFEILDSGELAEFDITNTSDADIGTQTAGVEFTIKLAARDGTGQLLDGTGQPEYTKKAFIQSDGNSGSGLDSTANFSGGTVTHVVRLDSAGTFSISATGEQINTTNEITSFSNSFTVNPGVADPDTLTSIEAVPSSIVANGTSSSLITVTLFDSLGNRLTSGGDNVEISTDAGTLESTASGSGLTTVTADDQGDGTYTATLRSTTNVETATISATVNSAAITTGNAAVDFVAGGLDKFLVEAAGGGNIGTQTAGQAFNIRITAQDANDNTVTTFSNTVEITSNKTISSGGSTSPNFVNGVLNNHSITLTQSGNDATITATNSTGTQTGTSNTFTVNPAATDPATTTITPANDFIENNGTSTTVITIQAKDQFGNNRNTGGEPVTLSTTAGTLQGSISDNGDGTYTQNLQSSTNIETATVTGTINGTGISDDAQVTFTEFNTWTSRGGGGPTPTDWSDAGNWTLGVPTSNQAVIIPSNPVDANKFPIVTSNPTIAFLQIESGATVNVDPGFSITVTGNVSGNGALIVDAGTATIGGNISVANFNAGNSTVTLNGSDTQDIPGSLITDILNIQNSSSTGISVTNYVNADTRLTVTNSRLTMESGSTFEVFNDVTGNGRIDSDDATFLIGGDVTVDTMNVSNSDVTFNGTGGGQSINNITGYRNLTVSNTSGNVIHNGDATISQQLTINSGATFGITGDLTTNDLSAAGGNLRLQGDFAATNVTAAPNTVAFTGGNPQELIDFDTFNNLTINKTANEVTSSSDVIVNGTLSLTSGDLVMGSGTNLLAPNRNLSGGQIRFQLDLSSRGWYAISAPVSSTYSDLLDSVVTQGYQGAFYSTGSNPGDTLQPNVLYYDETADTAETVNQRWRALNNASDPIVESRGHFLFVFGDVSGDPLYNRSFPRTLEVAGNEFTGSGSEVDFGITYTPAPADTGWNLVGNPYGATVDWDDSGNWTKTNVDQTIYVWDHSANGGNGEYLTWNGFTGSLGNGLIAPFQGFWVKANGSSPVLTVSDNAKTTGGIFREAPSKQNSRNRPDEDPPIVGLKLDKGELSSELYFMFSEDATTLKDELDAYRLIPFTSTFLEFYSTTDRGEQLKINNMPRRFGKTIDIPVFVGGFDGNQAITGTYTISWPALEDLPSEWEVVLFDKEANKEINLRNESFYSFDVKDDGKTAQSNSSVNSNLGLRPTADEDDSRFALRISPGADAGDLPGSFELDQNYPNPFNPETTVRFGLPVESDVNITIYDILGRRVYTLADRRFTAGTHTLTWNPLGLASGVYLYRLVTDEKIITKKMTYIK